MSSRRSGRPRQDDRLLAESTGTPRGQLFRREGEYWTIVYEGTLFRLRNGRGLQYLACLLSRPDERIHCSDLWSSAGRAPSAAAASAERTRVAVTKRIKASVTKIAALHPGLAKHLNARIRTGYFCVYACDPREGVPWMF